MKLIAEGAEAQIWDIGNDVLKKVRLVKPYRLEEIDFKLRSFRNKREFKVLSKLSEVGVLVPKPYELFVKDELCFTFEYVKGNVLKGVLNKELLFRVFDEIIKMHDLDIIHGDLTTLNMIERGKKVYLIDFGLSNFSSKVEDKAVDLNLFFTCIKNEHPDFFEFKNELLNKYIDKVNLGDKIVKRVEEIGKRGRNK